MNFKMLSAAALALLAAAASETSAAGFRSRELEHKGDDPFFDSVRCSGEMSCKTAEWFEVVFDTNIASFNTECLSVIERKNGQTTVKVLFTGDKCKKSADWPKTQIPVIATRPNGNTFQIGDSRKGIHMSCSQPLNEVWGAHGVSATFTKAGTGTYESPGIICREPEPENCRQRPSDWKCTNDALGRKMAIRYPIVEQEATTVILSDGTAVSGEPCSEAPYVPFQTSYSPWHTRDCQDEERDDTCDYIDSCFSRGGECGVDEHVAGIDEETGEVICAEDKNTKTVAHCAPGQYLESVEDDASGTTHFVCKDIVSGRCDGENEFVVQISDGTVSCAKITNLEAVCGEGQYLQGFKDSDDDSAHITPICKSVVSGQCEQGSYVKSINEDGSISCEEDKNTKTVAHCASGQYLERVEDDVGGTTHFVCKDVVSGRCEGKNEFVVQISDGTVSCASTTNLEAICNDGQYLQGFKDSDDDSEHLIPICKDGMELKFPRCIATCAEKDCIESRLDCILACAQE